jgi:hypothetical protein
LTVGPAKSVVGPTSVGCSSSYCIVGMEGDYIALVGGVPSKGFGPTS